MIEPKQLIALAWQEFKRRRPEGYSAECVHDAFLDVAKDTMSDDPDFWPEYRSELRDRQSAETAPYSTESQNVTDDTSRTPNGPEIEAMSASEPIRGLLQATPQHPVDRILQNIANEPLFPLEYLEPEAAKTVKRLRAPAQTRATYKIKGGEITLCVYVAGELARTLRPGVGGTEPTYDIFDREGRRVGYVETKNPISAVIDEALRLGEKP